eukprot:282740_1
MAFAIVFLGIQNYYRLSTLHGVSIDRKKWQFIADIFDATFIEVFNDGDKEKILYALEEIKDTLPDFHNILFVLAGHGTVEHATRTLCLVTKNESTIPIEYIIERYSSNKWSARKHIKFAYVLDLCFGNITSSHFNVNCDVYINPLMIQDLIRVNAIVWTLIIGAASPYLSASNGESGGGHLTDVMCRGILQCTQSSNAQSHTLTEFIKTATHIHNTTCNNKNCSQFYEELNGYLGDDSPFRIHISSCNLSRLQQQTENELMAEYLKLDQISNDSTESHKSIIENVTNTLSSGISWLTNTISRGIRGGYENNNIKYITEINNDRGFLLTAGYIHYRIYVTKHPDYQEIIINIINIFLIGNNTGNNTDNISPFIVINCSCGYGHLSEPKKLNKLPFYNPNKYLKCWMDCRSRLMSTSVVYYCKGIECNYVVCEECIRQNNRGYNVLKQYLLERKNKYSKHDFKQSEGNVVVELLTCGNRNWKWILVRLNDNSNLGEYDPMSNDDKRNQNKRIYLLKPLKKARKTQSSQRKWLCRSCLTEIKTKTNRKRALEKHRC